MEKSSFYKQFNSQVPSFDTCVIHSSTFFFNLYYQNFPSVTHIIISNKCDDKQCIFLNYFNQIGGQFWRPVDHRNRRPVVLGGQLTCKLSPLVM